MSLHRPDLSIVIPAYNAAAFLEKAVRSARAQRGPGFSVEVVVVDDGSVDGTAALLDRLEAEADSGPFIRVRQANGGLSRARNAGIEASTAPYLCFLDADDALKPGALASIAAAAAVAEADVAVFNHERIEGALRSSGKVLSRRRAMAGLDYFIQTVRAGYYPVMACVSLWRRGFLDRNKLRFEPGIYHEDIDFFHAAMLTASRVISFDLKAYEYFIQPASITQDPSRRVKRRDDLVALEERLAARAASSGGRRFAAATDVYILNLILPDLLSTGLFGRVECASMARRRVRPLKPKLVALWLASRALPARAFESLTWRRYGERYAPPAQA